jgi:cell division protein FtsW (lipid II flippase)
MYLPFLGATVLFISQYLQTSYGLERIKVLLHPEKAPEEGGYAAMVIKGLLENAKLIGTGDIPARYTGSSKFPLGALHTDYMLTYLIHRMGWLAFGVVIALFITFILLGVRQCLSQKSVLGQLVSVSVLLTFSFQTVHYIGYNLGFQFMAPLSLPLVSYGGVTMVVNMGLLGLLLSVFRNGSAARDRAQSSSARQPFITWRERKLVIDFGRKNGE